MDTVKQVGEWLTALPFVRALAPWATLISLGFFFVALMFLTANVGYYLLEYDRDDLPRTVTVDQQGGLALNVTHPRVIHNSTEPYLLYIAPVASTSPLTVTVARAEGVVVLPEPAPVLTFTAGALQSRPLAVANSFAGEGWFFPPAATITLAVTDGPGLALLPVSIPKEQGWQWLIRRLLVIESPDLVTLALGLILFLLSQLFPLKREQLAAQMEAELNSIRQQIIDGQEARAAAGIRRLRREFRRTLGPVNERWLAPFDAILLPGASEQRSPREMLRRWWRSIWQRRAPAAPAPVDAGSPAPAGHAPPPASSAPTPPSALPTQHVHTLLGKLEQLLVELAQQSEAIPRSPAEPWLPVYLAWLCRAARPGLPLNAEDRATVRRFTDLVRSNGLVAQLLGSHHDLSLQLQGLLQHEAQVEQHEREQAEAALRLEKEQKERREQQTVRGPFDDPPAFPGSEPFFPQLHEEALLIPSEQPTIIVITGRSGSGRTAALRFFHDKRPGLADYTAAIYVPAAGLADVPAVLRAVERALTNRLLRVLARERSFESRIGRGGLEILLRRVFQAERADDPRACLAELSQILREFGSQTLLICLDDCDPSIDPESLYTVLTLLMKQHIFLRVAYASYAAIPLDQWHKPPHRANGAQDAKGDLIHYIDLTWSHEQLVQLFDYLPLRHKSIALFRDKVLDCITLPADLMTWIKVFEDKKDHNGRMDKDDWQRLLDAMAAARSERDPLARDWQLRDWERAQVILDREGQAP